tara:strand:+ start:1823 stop:2026 length:204 start_codon:yes stop_codon:yes gene_type:complete
MNRNDVYNLYQLLIEVSESAVRLHAEDPRGTEINRIVENMQEVVSYFVSMDVDEIIEEKARRSYETP